MYIPLKIQIPVHLRSIKDFRIVCFEDKTLQYPDPHWYVIIPTQENSKFLVIIVTSKVNERIEYYKKTSQPKAAECLVKINNNEFSFLYKNSAINCNETQLLSIDEIVHKVDEAKGFKIEKEKIPEYLKREIVSAILKSPLIPKLMGKLAKAAHPL